MKDLTELMKLLESPRIISIIGLAKNVSKTTTLNHLIQAFDNNLLIGLTSIGRDGEKYDVITELPKPRIKIKKGTYFATAMESKKRCEIKTELIKNMKINTSLGEIKIYKSLNDGVIELAGPSTNNDLLHVCLSLLDLGCKKILIDGAFDRKSFASPLISDATILSTGASVSKNMKNVIKSTIHLLNLFSLDILKDSQIREIASQYINSAMVAIIEINNQVKVIDISTALGHEKDILNEIEQDSRYLIICGALTDRLLKEILKNDFYSNNLTIIVEDATKIFISEEIFINFFKKGAKIKVLRPITILAVTINPTSPLGYSFKKEEFLELLKEKTEIPVYDLGPNI